MVIEAGRALVLALNKWDPATRTVATTWERESEREFAQVQWAPRVNISATTGRAVQKLVPALETALDSWDARISTGQLIVAEGGGGGEAAAGAGAANNRDSLGTQATARPPTFVLFTTGFLEAGYRRFLERRLRETFGFRGAARSGSTSACGRKRKARSRVPRAAL